MTSNNYSLRRWCLACSSAFIPVLADTIILLPAFVSILRTCDSVPLRAGAALMLTPVPYFMVLSGVDVQRRAAGSDAHALVWLSSRSKKASRYRARFSTLVADLSQQSIPPLDAVGPLYSLGRRAIDHAENASSLLRFRNDHLYRIRGCAEEVHHLRHILDAVPGC